MSFIEDLLQDPIVSFIAFGIIVMCFGMIVAVKRRLNPPVSQNRNASSAKENLSSSVRYLVILLIFAGGLYLVHTSEAFSLYAQVLSFYVPPFVWATFYYVALKFISAVYHVCKDTHSQLLFALFLLCWAISLLPVIESIYGFIAVFFTGYAIFPDFSVPALIALSTSIVPYILIYIHARRSLKRIT